MTPDERLCDVCEGLIGTPGVGLPMSKEWRFMLMTLILIAILAGGTFLLFYFGPTGP